MSVSWIIVYMFHLYSVTNSRTIQGGKGIIVDSDPGGDDAMALIMLSRAEDRGHLARFGRILMVTTVKGNTGSWNASRAANYTLRLVNKSQVPVYLGAEDNLGIKVEPTWYYGYDGIGDFLPPVLPPQPDITRPAAMHIADTVKNNPNGITIIGMGPLTNLALAILYYPNLLNDVRHIYILGGTYKGGGNMGPGVEANMYGDSLGAAYFFSKARADRVTLMPIEPVLENKFTMEWRQRILGSLKSRAMKFLNLAERVSTVQDGKYWPCYDPSLVAVILQPSIVQSTRKARVTLETKEPQGYMKADFGSEDPNVNIITSFNKSAIEKMLLFYLSI